MDATYRSDLRELNESNFARFDAKLEQRAAELNAKIERRIAELGAELRAEMRVGFARVDQRFAEFETRLTNRLFAFWVAQAAATVGLVLGIVKLIK